MAVNKSSNAVTKVLVDLRRSLKSFILMGKDLKQIFFRSNVMAVARKTIWLVDDL